MGPAGAGPEDEQGRAVTISDRDREMMGATSVEIIGGTGEAMIRARLDTSLRPASFDEDFGEATDKSEEIYLELELTGKVLELTEKLMMQDFGGSVDADCVVHVPIGDDVVAGDFLIFREQWYEVGPVRESELKTFRACAVRKTSARMGGAVSGSGGAPVPHWAHAAEIRHLAPAWYTFKTWDMLDFYAGSYYLVGCRVSCGKAADGEWVVRVTATGIGVADKTWDVTLDGAETSASLRIDESLDVAQYRQYAIAARLSADVGDTNPVDVDVELISRATA